MTFYFYDLETSGINPRSARIMQFAGQRTDMDLKPVGQPDNFLIKLNEDVLPEPDAVLVTGITPQQTLAEGITEAEFLKHFTSNICTDDTVFVGYNNVRFDDEFIRFTLWRNFYDAYEWQWKQGCSRWDLLDAVRMTRALRPEGIEWPFAPDGKPSNRLNLISSINGLDHENAHDALSDVGACIAVAGLLKSRQPKLFDFLLKLRDKTKVEALVTKAEPLVYTSGRYPGEYEKTTVAVMAAPVPSRGALMYDLRVDPAPFEKMTAAELAQAWQARGDGVPYFPVKLLSYNRCPAVAPLNVLDPLSAKRLKVDLKDIDKNLKKLTLTPEFGDKLVAAFELTQQARQTGLVADEQQVDTQLYDGFVSSADKVKMQAVRAASSGDELAKLNIDFRDERLKLLLPLYKARNYPASLSSEEKAAWDNFKNKKLVAGGENSPAARYFKRLNELAINPQLDDKSRYLLEELNLYGQSILPSA